MLEDETGRVQVVLPPALAETIRQVLAESRLIAVSGTIERTRQHHTLLARQMRPLPANRARKPQAAATGRRQEPPDDQRIYMATA